MTSQVDFEHIRSVRLNLFRVLIIGGPDRVEFLQGQLTQDLLKLETAGTALAGLATAKGRLLATGQLIAAGDEIWWPMPFDIIENVAKRLQMFVLRANVKIVQSVMPVAGIFGVNDPDIRPIAGETVPLDDQPHWLDGGNLVIRTIGDPDRAWLIGPAAGSNDLKSIDDSAWVLGSIRAGLPFIVAATQELFVPQMLNLDRLGAISFDKGCYVGQEIIARTQNLGRIKRRMYGFRSDQATSLDPGMTIYGPDSATGKVVLAADNELLAVVPIDQSAGDWFADEERMLPLKPTPLPCDETGRSKQ